MYEPEEMTTEELVSEYRELAAWIQTQADQDSPQVLSTGDYMLDLRYEYHHRTGENIAEAGMDAPGTFYTRPSDVNAVATVLNPASGAGAFLATPANELAPIVSNPPFG